MDPTFDRLVQAHREIYREDHDKQWPTSKSELDTYILIRLFAMVKHTKEFAETLEIRGYANFKFLANTNPRKEYMAK